MMQKRAMAGSKGGKNSERKGKSKSNTSDTVNKKLEISNSKLDLARALNFVPVAARDPECKNPQPGVSSELSTSRSSYTENELEELFQIKLTKLYTKAKEQLLQLGYGMSEVETALLHAGHFHGQMDLLDNVVNNSIAYIEEKVGPDTTFKDIDDLYRSMHEAMILSVMQTRQIKRLDAVWYLINRKWDRVLSDTASSWSLSKDEKAGGVDQTSAENAVSETRIALSSKKVGIFRIINLSSELASHLRSTIRKPTASVQGTVADPIDVPDIMSSDLLSIAGSSFDDPETALITDLVTDISELREKVKEQKKWAQKKVLESARRLSKDFQELKMLRMEILDKEKVKNEKIYAEKICVLRLIETEQSLQKANADASVITNSVRKLEDTNDQMRADIEAIKLNASEHEKKVREVLKRGRRCAKKLVDFEKQAAIFKSQIKEENQRVLKLKVELPEAEKEADEAEKQLKREVKKKEKLLARVAQETIVAETRRANSTAHLLKLKQKVEIDSQLARDDLQRLEHEMSCLLISREMPDKLQDDVDFWYNHAETASSSSTAPCESLEEPIGHWTCMLCLKNEVSVVFLPCTHQVTCSACYSVNSERKGGRCPYCQAKIKESIRVYGPSS